MWKIRMPTESLQIQDFWDLNEFIRVQNRTTWSILESGHMVPVERMLSNKEQSLCDSDTIIGHSYQINQGYEVLMLF